ncbi:MAG TPA: serine/threonine-protein kinase [Caulifigura sp.]|jgi:WD40 repeat protein/predicted Ser/Thr protein kinase|nr:serine/threonine-protein kinase [Caulifigura sp.]
MGETNPKRSEPVLGQSVEATHIPVPRSKTDGPPQVFGRYRVQRLLGRGAMGAVYLADDTQLSRKVALKLPHFNGEDTDRALERFYREARLAATLRNPYICPVYDVGEIQGLHYISMAYIEGKPLSDLIKTGGPQKERASLILVRKLAMALEAAHSAGIIHRDLKPANVMIDARGEPVVMDFGLAFQASNDAARLTHSGTVLGSPAYMSPEQLSGKAVELTPASDQFALGVVLFELLTGELPFRGTVSAVAHQIVNAAPPSLRQLRPELDPRTEKLCRKLLAKRPADRFGSMREVAEQVTACLKGEQPSKIEKEAAPAAIADETAPGQSIQQQVEKLLAWGELVSALETLELGGSQLTGKQAEWARQKRVAVRKQIEHWKQELPAQRRVARQLVAKHDYADAVNVLSVIPVGVRDEETASLLQEAQEKAEEVEQLLKDIEKVFRTGTDDELKWLVKRFLQLKPGHIKVKALAEDLKRYGADEVIRQRRKRRDFLDPAGRIWEAKQFVYYAAGLGAACALMFAASIAFQAPVGFVSIEVLDAPIEIDFLSAQVSVSNTGQSFRLKADEKQMLAVRLAGDLVPEATRELSVERNETKRVKARLVHGKVELSINSEIKVFAVPAKSRDPATTPSEAPRLAAVTAPTGETIDLLAAVDPAKATGSIMAWERVNGVLTGTVKPGVDLAWVSLTPPVDFEGDYDLDLEYLVQGSDYHSVAFPLNETTLGLAITPKGCGLQWIDGKAFETPAESGGPRLRPGQPQKLALTVRHSGEDVTIKAVLDGETAAQFSGRRSRLEIPKAAVPAPGKLRIVTPISIPQPTSRLEVRKASLKRLPASSGRALVQPASPPQVSQPSAVATGKSPRDFIINADFRKSSGGMNQADQDFILEEHKNGEFRYLGKKAGWWYAPFHGAQWKDENNSLRDFAVEFDIRIPTPKRGEFAVEFGRMGDDTLSLCYNQLGQVRLLSAGRNLVAPTASAAMKPVDQFNTVRMEVRDRVVTVTVNGGTLFEHKLPVLGGRHVQAWLYVEDYPFDVRLQRYQVERLGKQRLRQFDGAIRRFEGHTGAIRGIAFLPDGEQAVSVADDHAFKLWNVSSGQMLHDFSGHTGPVTSVSISGDGKRALTGCNDGVVRLWDLEGRLLIKALKGHAAPVSSVLIAKEGHFGFSASQDGSIRRWDLKSFTKPAVLPGPGGDATLIHSPDESLVAASSMDGSVVIRGSKAAGSLVGHDPGAIRAMAFTPDGTKLTAAGCVSSVLVWDVANGKVIHRLKGDDAGFASVAVTSDGRFVVAGCRDHTVRVWNLETGDEVAKLRAAVPVTHRLALSPDDKHVLTGGGDGANRADYSLRLWALSIPTRTEFRP